MESYGGSGHQYQFPFDRSQYYTTQLHHTGQQTTQNTSNNTAFDVVAANHHDRGIYATQPELSVSGNNNNTLFPFHAAASVNNMHSTLGYEPLEVYSTHIPIKQQHNNHNYLDFELSIPGISLTPLTALQVVEKVKKASNEVTSRFLPCVDFLVTCQQELRAGLSFSAKQKQVGRGCYRDNMTPLQFYIKYLDPLPVRFAKKNARVMFHQHVSLAADEVTQLCIDAKKNINYGCESVKNAFLGGMRDGESWGLRRWLSKNGGALHICSDLEHIFQALQTMDNEADTTRQLAAAIRPLASQVHERLITDVPSAYQEVSSAHPYLPFFHRLESALKSLATFDPDDDDVVIIDDEEEIQAAKNKSKNSNCNKREITELFDCEDFPPDKKGKHEHHNNNANLLGKHDWKHAYQLPTATDPLQQYNNNQSNPKDDDLSDCEVICVTNGKTNGTAQTQCHAQTSSSSKQIHKPLSTAAAPIHDSDTSGWRCTQCTFMNAPNAAKCVLCSNEELDSLDPMHIPGITPINTQPQQEAACIRPGDVLAGVVESIASEYEEGLGYRPEYMHFFQTEMFWNRPLNYAHALRLLGTLLRDPSSAFLVEPFMGNSSDDAVKSIVNPICFRDIVNALVGHENDQSSRTTNRSSTRRGQLQVSLNWNMFYGRDFLEAIDLVILNGLVFYSREKGTYVRTCIIKLRKCLWDEINSKVKDRSNMPTKRSEKSGFVVRRNKKGGR